MVIIYRKINLCCKFQRQAQRSLLQLASGLNECEQFAVISYIIVSLYYTIIVTFRISGVLMFLLTAFTSLVGLAVCSFIFGFFNAASSPTVNECILIVTGSECFNFGYGQSAVFMGVGVVLGAPIAGRY